MEKAEVILQNVIDKRFKGDVTVLLMDKENNAVALARRSVMIEYREARPRSSLKLGKRKSHERCDLGKSYWLNLLPFSTGKLL